MLYKIALFLHVIGALLLCAAMVMEWLCIINLRKADTIKSIKDVISNYSVLSKIGGIAMLLILIPGIYMTAVVWKNVGWIIIAFIGIILIGIVGGTTTAKKMKKFKKTILKEDSIFSDIESVLHSPSFRLSIQLRTIIFSGIIFLMTVRPGLTGSIITLIASILIGIIPIQKKPTQLSKLKDK